MANGLRIDYNHDSRKGWHGPNKPRFGVLHSTESNDAEGLADIKSVMAGWDRGTGERKGVGAHWVNDQEGKRGEYVPPHQIAWHCLNRNTNSVGIEQIAFARFSASRWKARAKQLLNTAQIMAWCNDESKHPGWSIPLKRDLNRGWETHARQSAVHGEGQRTDPGKDYPFRSVMALAKVCRGLRWYG